MTALKGVIVLMTIAIIALMSLIGYGVYQKSTNPNFKFFNSNDGEVQATPTPTPPIAGKSISINPPPPVSPALVAAPFGNVSLGLAAGEQIISANVSGNRLVIITRQTKNLSPTDRIWIVDMISGTVMGSVTGNSQTGQ